MNLPSDLRDRNQARALQAQGEWVTVADVEVDVQYAEYRQGREGTVDRVRVRFEGTETPVHLGNVFSVRGAPMISDEGADGWRRPTSDTGYEPPLQVRIRRESGGRVEGAMAREDYEYWTVDNVDPEIGLTLSVGGLIAAASLIAFNSIRVRRRRRK